MSGSRHNEEASLRRHHGNLTGRLTLVYLLLDPIGQWWVQIPVLSLSALGLLFPRVARMPALWWGLAGGSCLRVAHGWTWMDNHAYLLTYWLLAFALYRSLDLEEEDLATNARWLVGAAFLFAVLWKAALTTDFVSGDFFHLTLLTDSRFRDLGLLLGYVTPELWQSNLDAVERLLSGEVGSVTLGAGPALERVVLATTWWTVVIESLVAAAFLLPPRRWRWNAARHALLLLFAWSVYPFATVAGFGWLLMILGLAQCPRERRTYRILYLVTFLGILVMRDAPWTAALLALR